MAMKKIKYKTILMKLPSMFLKIEKAILSLLQLKKQQKDVSEIESKILVIMQKNVSIDISATISEIYGFELS